MPMTMKRIIRSVSYRIAPAMTWEFERQRDLVANSERLGQESAASTDLGELVEARLGQGLFKSD